MTEDVALLVRALFWLLAAFAALLPMRWALLSYILLSHIDITTSAYASATNVGFENTFKTVVVPTIMGLRFARGWIGYFRTSRLAVLWLLVTVYATLACIWTPFVLPGFKLVAYLYCYLILGAVFLEGWNRGQVTPRFVALALWISLSMAVVQTYLLGNFYGTSPDGLDVDRFTSFCSPQTFGAFLLAALSILFVTSRLSLRDRLLHGAGGFIGIGLSGSRYVFIGTLFLLPIVWASHYFRRPPGPARATWIVAGMASAVLAVGATGIVVLAVPDNRISQLVTMTLEGRSPLDNVGTFIWRMGIYEQAWTQLRQREPGELVFGSGTSSGALAVLGWDRRYHEDSIDANRVMHNEILRVMFEWGALGLLLFGLFTVVLARQFIHALRDRVIPAYAFVALLPTIILGCLTENILASAASPAGVGFSLVLFYGISYQQRAAFLRARTTVPA